MKLTKIQFLGKAVADLLNQEPAIANEVGLYISADNAKLIQNKVVEHGIGVGICVIESSRREHADRVVPEEGQENTAVDAILTYTDKLLTEQGKLEMTRKLLLS